MVDDAVDHGCGDDSAPNTSTELRAVSEFEICVSGGSVGPGRAGAAGLPASPRSWSSGWGLVVSSGAGSPGSWSALESMADAQGQEAGSRRCRRRPLCTRRPGTVKIRRRRVVAVAFSRSGPARRPTARARLWAITASASQAALAMNLPDGRCARPALLSSAIRCSTTACRRWSASISSDVAGPVGDEGVVVPGGEQRQLASRGWGGPGAPPTGRSWRPCRRTRCSWSRRRRHRRPPGWTASTGSAPRRLVDGLDRGPDLLVLPGGHRELDAELDRGAEHGPAVEGAVGADRQLPGRAGVTDPADGLGQEGLRAAGRARRRRPAAG